MGIKTGQFRTLGNDLITVTFTGDNIADGALTLATSPVILQMDGGSREYTPIKYTTASITCVCNGVELFDLYAQDPLAVAVEVRNSTQEQALFAGYVTPNNFNQPIDGVNDAVTIECVDWLGIAKYMQYKKITDAFSILTIREVVLHIFSIITSMASVYMSQFVTLGGKTINNDGYTTRYPEMKLSESFFFKNSVTPDIDENVLSIERQALSCYEVLEMIAKSIRGTWVQVGNCVYMCDIIGIINNSLQNFYSLRSDISISDDVTSTGVIQAITGDSFSSTGNTVSSLPRYSQFTLTRELAERSLIPPIFQKKYLKQDGYIKTESWYDNPEQFHPNQRSVIRLSSRLVSFTTDESDVPTLGAEEPNTGATSSAFFFGAQDDPIDTDQPFISDLWGSNFTDYLRVYQSGVFSSADTQPSDSDYVQVNIDNRFVLPTTGCNYYCIGIKMQAAKMIAESASDLDYYYPNKLIKGGDDIKVYVRLKCGNKYYRRYYADKEAGWQDNEIWSSLTLRGDGEWKSVLGTYYTSDILDGNIEISLRFRTNQILTDKRPSVTIIKSFDVQLIQSDVDKSCAYRTSRQNSITEGTYDFNNYYGEETTPISFGVPMVENNYSSYIEGVQYSRQTATNNFGKMCFFYNGQEYTLLDRIVALATFGDGREFNLNLKDPHNALSPLDAFTSPLWQGNKVMMGFQRDVERNEINVTLD